MPLADSSSLGLASEKNSTPGSNGSLSYEVNIKPIFLANCNSCHGPGKMNPNDWQNYDNVFAKKDQIYQRVVTLRNMPLTGSLAQSDRDLIGAWIKAGAPQFASATPTPSGPNPAPGPGPTGPTPGGPVPTPPNPTPTPVTPAQQAQLSDKLHYCAWCHGPTGAEAYSVAPRLAGQPAGYIASQLANFVSHTRDNPNSSGMMWGAVTGLDPSLIPLIADFYSKQTLSVSGSVDGKLANRGKEIYNNGIPDHNVIACALCHGPDGKGNDNIPRLADQDKYYIIRQLQDWKSGYRAYAAPMPDEAKGMSDDDIRAVAEYVNFLK